MREGGEGGGSSAMPHKAEPGRRDVGTGRGRARPPRLRADGRPRRRARAGGRGAWQAEWEALSGALATAGGAASALAGSLEGAPGGRGPDAGEPRSQRGSRRRGATSPRPSQSLGRTTARSLVRDASLRASDSGRSLAEELGERDFGLTAAELDAALDPAAYLGSSGALVDRALARYEAKRAREGAGGVTAAPRPRRVCGCAGGRAVELARRRTRCGGRRSPRCLSASGRPQRPARAQALTGSTGRRGSTTSARTSSSCSTSSGSSACHCACPRRSGGGVARPGPARAGRPAGARVHGGVVPPRRPGRRAALVRTNGVPAIADAVLARWFRPVFHDTHSGVVTRFGAMLASTRGLRRLLRRSPTPT